MTMRCAVLMVLFAYSALAQQSLAQQQGQQRLRQQGQPPQPRMTVGDLRVLCAVGEATGKSSCRYYILGAAQGIGLGAGEAGGRNPVCIPDGVPDDDVVAVVKRAMAKYLTAFPNELGKPAVSLVGAALMQAYPCGR